jgi:hypothetical protein
LFTIFSWLEKLTPEKENITSSRYYTPDNLNQRSIHPPVLLEFSGYTAQLVSTAPFSFA